MTFLQNFKTKIFILEYFPLHTPLLPCFDTQHSICEIFTYLHLMDLTSAIKSLEKRGGAYSALEGQAQFFIQQFRSLVTWNQECGPGSIHEKRSDPDLYINYMYKYISLVSDLFYEIGIGSGLFFKGRIRIKY